MSLIFICTFYASIIYQSHFQMNTFDIKIHLQPDKVGCTFKPFKLTYIGHNVFVQKTLLQGYELYFF